MGWEQNQLTPGSFLIRAIDSNPAQNPQCNAGSLSLSGTSPILLLQSVGCFVVTLLETWEGFKPGMPRSRMHTHPLQFVMRITDADQGTAGAGTTYWLTALLGGEIPAEEEKVEGSLVPDAEIKPTSQQQNPKVQPSWTHYWLPHGSAQLTAVWVAAALSGHTP